MRIRHLPEAALGDADRAEIHALRATAWPGSGDTRARLNDPALDPEQFIAERDGDPLAALAVLSKSLEHHGRWHVAGLSAVVTRTDARGTGVGSALVAAARAWMATRFDLGIFSCDRVLAPFYERCGWHVLPGAVLVGGTPDSTLATDDPRFDKVVVGDFFTGDARAAAGVFTGRIPLHPGSIDLLW